MSGKKIAALVTALVVLAASFTAVYYFTREKAQPEAPSTTAQANASTVAGKRITIDIVADGETKTVEIATNETHLRGALEQENLIAGREDAGSFFVTAVNGRAADDSKQEWWGIMQGGEFLMAGVNDTVIADGDRYEIKLFEGYDAFQ